MAKKKTTGTGVTVTRGLTNKDGQRIEPGKTAMAELEKLFDKESIQRWIERGIIKDGR